jgi:hypothetical protein
MPSAPGLVVMRDRSRTSRLRATAHHPFRKFLKETRAAQEAAGAMTMSADELAHRVGERIMEEFRGFWSKEDLYEAIPQLIREEADRITPSRTQESA